MSILNFTGFEIGTLDSLKDEFTSVISTGAGFSVVAGGKTGNYALQVNNPASSRSVQLARADTSNLNVATLYLRLYLKVDTAPSADFNFVQMNGGGAAKLKLILTSTMNLKITDAGGASHTGSTSLALHTWYRIEVKGGTGTSGAVEEVKIEGVTEISTTGNTNGNNYSDVEIGCFSNSVGVNCLIDDVELRDTEYPGAGSVVCLRPNAAGFYSQWTGGTGTTFAEVDDLISVGAAGDDVDATYLKTSTTGNRHSVGVENAADRGLIFSSINALKVHAVSRSETGIGSNGNSVVFVRSAGTNSDSSAFNEPTSYHAFQSLYATDPATSAAWTPAAVDAVEIGVKQGATDAQRCTMLNLMVSCVILQTPAGGFKRVAMGRPWYFQQASGIVSATDVKAPPAGGVMFRDDRRFLTRRPFEAKAPFWVPDPEVHESYMPVVEIDLDDQTLTCCFDGLRHPTNYYQDLLLDVSPITREMSIYSGQVSIGNCTVTFTNRGRYLSRLAHSSRFRGRTMRVKLVPLVAGMSQAFTIFTGQILTKPLFTTGKCVVSARTSYFDILFGLTLAQLAPTVNAANFPNVPASQVPVLAPLVLGRVGNVTGLAAGSTPGGDCPTYRVDATGSYIYLLAARPLGAEPAVGTLSEVFAYGTYNGAITVSTHTYNGVTHAVASFAVDPKDTSRPNEMEVSAFLNGFTEDDNPASTPILNIVRAMEYTLGQYAGLTSGFFDATKQSVAKVTAQGRGYADDATSSTPAFLGLVLSDQNETLQDVIAKFCETGGMKLYPTRDNLLATYVETDDELPAPDFSVSDSRDILPGSFSSVGNDQNGTVIQYNHAYRWTSGRAGDPSSSGTSISSGTYFQRQPDFVIPGEKTKVGLGVDLRQNLNLWGCRSSRVGSRVARAMAELYKSDADIVGFDLPIGFAKQADLNKIVGITHWQGPSATTQFVRGVRSGNDGFDRADSNTLGNGWTESEPDPSTLQILGGRLRMGWTGNHSAWLGIAIRSEAHPQRQLIRAQWLAKSWATGAIDATNEFGLMLQASGDHTALNAFGAVVNNGLLSLVNYVNATGTTGETVLASVPADDAIGTKFALGDTLELRAELIGAQVSLEVWVYSDDPDRDGQAIGPILATPKTGTPGPVARQMTTANGTTTDWDNIEIIDNWEAFEISGYDNAKARITSITYDVQPRQQKISLKCFKPAEYTRFKDFFGRADALSLGSDWTEIETHTQGTDLQIVSNALRIGDTNNVSAWISYAYPTKPWADNQLARAWWTGKSWAGANTVFFGGLGVRIQGSTSSFSGYAAVVNSGLLKLLKFVNAGPSSAGTLLTSCAADESAGSKFSVGDTLEIRVETIAGLDVIDVYVISETPSRQGHALSAISSNLPSGSPVIFAQQQGSGTSGTMDFKDFEANDF